MSKPSNNRLKRQADFAVPLIALAASLALGYWLLWMTVSPESPLSAHKIDAADLASEESAVKAAAKWMGGRPAKRIIPQALASMPQPEVVAIFARAVKANQALSFGSTNRCIFHLGEGAGEVDLKFAVAVVQGAGKGRICVNKDLRVFNGRTAFEAELLGHAVPRSVIVDRSLLP